MTPIGVPPPLILIYASHLAGTTYLWRLLHLLCQLGYSCTSMALDHGRWCELVRRRLRVPKLKLCQQLR